MKHYRIAFILAFVCALTVGMIHSKESSDLAIAISDEYVVYAVAMEEVVGGGSYVVMDTTSIHDKPENLDRALSFPASPKVSNQGNLVETNFLTEDLVKDFKAKNQKGHPLGQLFPKGVHVTLITENERSTMFSGCMLEETKDCGWKAFRAKYSGAGITTLSRVGFNNKHDTALVYVGNVRDWEVGQGVYLLLAKSDSQWKVISKTRAWIS